MYKGKKIVILKKEKSDIMNNAKIVFMGTPTFSVPILKMLIENYQVIAVVTQPDKLVGRHQVLTPSKVKEEALKHQIPVYQPSKIKTDYQAIIDLNPDLIITCAYGQIIPKELLNAPKMGCYNVHASLLPKYRGGAPIHKALINGETETGITIMYMEEGMDTGDIISQKSYQILAEDNVGTLHEKLSLLGAELLKETLPSIIHKTNSRQKQNPAEVTYAYNIKREEEHLNFQKKGVEIINHIRGLNPWPTANLILNGEELKVLEAYYEQKEIEEPGIILEITKSAIGITCQDGIIYVTKIKPFGKKIMTTKDYLNGMKKENIFGLKVQ